MEISDLERLRAFLADIDHSGELTAKRASQYLKLLDRAGTRGRKRYRAAVALTRAQGGKPPSLLDFRRYGTNRNARTVLLLLEAGFSLPFSNALLEKYRPVAAVPAEWTKHWSRAVAVARECGVDVDPEEVRGIWATRFESLQQQRQRYRQRQLDQHGPELRALAERDADRVVEFVRRTWDQTGEGPTWLEVSTAMDWPHWESVHRIGVEHLIDMGLLTSTTEPRSLDIVEAPRSPPRHC